MSRTDSERMGDIHAAIARCMAYRDHLDSAELGDMAYDAILRNVVVHEYFRVNPDMIRDIVDNRLAPLLNDIG